MLAVAVAIAPSSVSVESMEMVSNLEGVITYKMNEEQRTALIKYPPTQDEDLRLQNRLYGERFNQYALNHMKRK